jgi:signal transduction histidine kinase
MAGLRELSSGATLSREQWLVVTRAAWLGAILPFAALSSRGADWQPVSLVIALALLMALADAVDVGARKIRQSSGLTVQVTAMALLGPAPAVVIGLFATSVESVVNRVRLPEAMTNVVMFSALGLIGGVLFGVLGDAFGVDRDDTRYAALTLPVYCVLAGLNILIVVVTSPRLAWPERLRLFRESALPTVPWELISAVIAAAAVLAWAEAGLLAVVLLLLFLLVVTTPLLRVLETAIKSGDDVVALREVSDQRAAEVARLASDRSRLLDEVLHAEEHERARLAESLHDGPMQRLTAMRQDVREAGATDPDEIVAGLDAAIAEARAIVSALHPAAVRELGFEGALRAAAAPFALAHPVALAVRSELPDDELTGTLLLPIAQELVVNAVKHAEPTRVEVRVAPGPGGIVLEVSDDGVGIDTTRSDRAVQAGHVGLAVVRRRVEDAGGRFEIATREDGGTRSRVTVPELRR